MSTETSESILNDFDLDYQDSNDKKIIKMRIPNFKKFNKIHIGKKLWMKRWNDEQSKLQKC
jgi:hypothetical protein